eukprot:423668_1
MKAKLFKYKLEIKSANARFGNSYEDLVSNEMDSGAATEQVNNAFLIALFDHPIRITLIEIAALTLDQWGIDDINDGDMQYKFKDGEWKTLWANIDLKSHEIHKREVSNIIATHLRIIKTQESYLGLACWRIHGFNHE